MFRYLLFCLLLTNFLACTPESKGDASTITSQKKVEITLLGQGESMSDMKFDQETLRVPEGAMVHLTLVNKSKAAGMLHNFVLVEFGKTANVALLAINAKDQDYVPKHAAIIAASPMARPGETVEVEFQAPPKGNYQFICSYPGHAMSMRGLFIVE